MQIHPRHVTVEKAKTLLLELVCDKLHKSEKEGGLDLTSAETLLVFAWYLEFFASGLVKSERSRKKDGPERTA